MKSCLYTGWVRHRRYAPRPHAFRYPLFMAYLDLAELDRAFEGRWLWSARRPALARFRREDHFGSRVPLEQAVRELVQAHSGRRPAGPIRLLTHLRYFGYVFNPVSFFYCFDAAGENLETIVAEVNNTPWGERHCYVLEGLKWDTGKAMHVSPFMPMDLRYAWRFTTPGAHLGVHMRLTRAYETIFEATLALRREPIGNGVLVRFPLMTAKVIAAIHWEALRLWLKRIPFHPHPAKLQP
jgi:DUF1365 family protein